MDQLKQFISIYGYKGFARLLLYPVLILFEMPVKLLATLWNCRLLLYRDISAYPAFSLWNAMNNRFYHTRALNLKRFGRNGKSPYLGLGDYQLSRCFHYSLFSLYTFTYAGAFVVLISMLLWLGAHLVWYSQVDTLWLGIVLALTLISTNFYANTFRMQNYNAVGWVFFPVFLWACFHQHWWVAGAALFLQTFGSFTATVIGTGVLGALSLWHLEILPLLMAAPACLKLGGHFYPFFINGDFKQIITNVMKAIGMIGGKAVKYRRTQSRKLNARFVYLFLLHAQFGMVLLWQSSWEIPVLFGLMLGFFVVNGFLVRFADDQSMFISLLSAGLVYVLQAPYNGWVLASFWVMASPLPGLIGFDNYKDKFFSVPVMGPYDIRPIADAMTKFLEKVPDRARIFAAFDDPGDIYEKVFNGYRRIFELPLFHAAQREIHLMPDWWAVFELNYQGAPEIWGRSPGQLKANMNYWQAQYALVYQDGEPILDPAWEASGFKVISHFDWSQFSGAFAPYAKLPYAQLNWWILEKGGQG